MRYQQAIEEFQQYIDQTIQCEHADIFVESFHHGVLSVSLRGACSGCPGMAVTVSDLLEGKMVEAFPQIKAVEAQPYISEETLDFARGLLSRGEVK